MNNPVVHQGSCLCGGVRYETTAPVKASSHCHCSMCRKAHGAAFASYGNVRRERHRFVLIGELHCGSPLLWHSEGAHADWVAVPLGTLDTPYDTPPQKHIYVDSKAPWVVIGDGYPQEPQG